MPRLPPPPHRALVFALGLGGAGCGGLAEPPELIRLERLTPSRIVGTETLQLSGDGLPDGRPAAAQLRGSLLRPGEEPLGDLRIPLVARPSGRDRLTLEVDAPTTRRLLGSVPGAHGTFRGELRVEYEAREKGLTSVQGILRDVRLDLMTGGASPSPEEPRSAALAAALGLSLCVDPSGAGLRVGGVATGSRADLAGIRAGDLLVELDGVSLLDAPDLALRGGQRRAAVVVERAGLLLPALDLDVSGLSPRAPDELALPGAAVALGALGLLLSGGRSGERLALWLRLLTPRARPGAGRAPAGRPSHAPLAVVALFVALVLVRISAGRALLSPGLDLWLLALVPPFALCVSRALATPRGGRPGRLRVAGESLGAAVPGLIATAGGVLSSGRFVLSEMVADQGGGPLRWAALQNPGLLWLAVLLLAGLVPELEVAGGVPAEGLLRSREARSPEGELARVTETGALAAGATLTALVFFGGTRVPGVTALEQEASPLLWVLGAGIGGLKVAALVALVLTLRRSIGGLSLSLAARPLGVRGALMALAAAALATGWAAALDASSGRLPAEIAARGAVALAAAWAALVVAAARRGATAPVTPGGVNPWI